MGCMLVAGLWFPQISLALRCETHRKQTCLLWSPSKGRGPKRCIETVCAKLSVEALGILLSCEVKKSLDSPCWFFRRPACWSDANDTQHLPQMVDLRVSELQRGQGFGSAFVRAIEREAAKAGYKQLYIAVEPANNPRAHALYQRLGYQQLQPKPYLKAWEFTDSGGSRHHGEHWVVNMVKPLQS
jgi:GNAT superfamily N-acetyltransferase